MVAVESAHRTVYRWPSFLDDRCSVITIEFLEVDHTKPTVYVVWQMCHRQPLRL
jgi:hypothetical protein